MAALTLKTTHKSIKEYYTALERYNQLGVTHETAVRSAFQNLLAHCAKKVHWALVPEHAILLRNQRRIVVDGALVDDFHLIHGYWEAKDIHDDLPTAAARKFENGYPRDNILFQTPKHAMLWQNQCLVLDVDLGEPNRLILVLETFFAHRQQEYLEWEQAIARFKHKVPELGNSMATLIQKQRQNNTDFTVAFANFHEKCRASINPNLSEAAVEEMLIQHLLTERVFRTVFDNPDFIHRNVIAAEIETVIRTLTSQAFSRDEFLQSLEPFYATLERTAATLHDFSQKQDFLNTVYEQFFQGFSVKIADTHGIVYTPQPIVDFMVRSVEVLLQSEFKRSLSDKEVHIIEPFVGTGNFIVRMMCELRKIALPQKYTEEFHCNEVMLLPYYIASMNIEHEFYQATGTYRPFPGICLVDTFELAEDNQLTMFERENTQRVEKQKQTPMFVVIGNPPYNIGQLNENDNNKNRKYPTLDTRIAETYAKDSKATCNKALYDYYIKAIRWASDRIGEEGVIAFVTNNGFIDGVAFDGMRKHLTADFDKIYVLDLGGNVRKGGKVSDANVFGIRVGVSINLFVKTRKNSPETCAIFYHRTDELWNRKQKFELLNRRQHTGNIAWQTVVPDARQTWLTEGLHAEFDTFMPMGTKAAKATKGVAVGVVFKTYGLGINTSRDAWAYNFNRNALTQNMSRMIDTYNEQALKWKHRENQKVNVDDFVIADSSKIKWSVRLKQALKKGKIANFSEEKIRNSIYRPFTKSNLYFDRLMNERVYGWASIFPTPETEKENRVICVAGIGNRKGFGCLATNMIPNLNLAFENVQCFPFYTYNEDGGHRRENITDWALSQFRAHYGDDTLNKWDIFHYIYGLLHHPAYRGRYQVNLNRDLPHIPFADDFWGFSAAGAELSTLHLNYETGREYKHARLIETPLVALNWCVSRMKFSKDKLQLHYNEFLTIAGIPPAVFEYRLGNRSALEWVVEQYRAQVDKRSGIVNEPNSAGDETHIVGLIRKVIWVSLETLRILGDLPAFGDSPSQNSKKEER